MNQVTLYCPRCGANNSPQSYFCNQCATQLRPGSVYSVSEGNSHSWRIPLIAMAAAFGTVAFMAVFAMLIMTSQKPVNLQQNSSGLAPTTLYQSPAPVSTATPLQNQTSQTKAAKSTPKPSPTPNQNYPVPSDEPEYRAAPHRSESKTIPSPPPVPPVERYNPSRGRIYIRGPRGGCYYINGSGNKTYVDRSMCD